MTSAALETVILDADLLSDSHVPGTLTARDREVAELDRWLSAAVTMRTPTHVWLHGPSGAGKTATALSVINRLQEEHGAENALINCWEHRTYFEVLDALVSEFRILRAEEHRSSLKLEKIRKHLNDRPCIIVVDEVDRMRPSERGATLYNLTKLGMVSLVCISNDEQAVHGLDERVRSRLSPHTIRFTRYCPSELARVLRDRALKALVPGTVPERALRQIAEAADGDARVGIRLLRNAVFDAQQQGRKRVVLREIEAEALRVRKVKQKHQLNTLTEDHRMLYQLLSEHQEIPSKDLRQAYLSRCGKTGRKPIAPRTFLAYTNRLVQAGLITSEPARAKGRVRLFKITR